MNIQVRLFAAARERAGTDEVELAVLPDATLQDVQDAMHTVYPGFQGMPGRWAVNLVFAAPAKKIEAGDEIAFIPPVSGG